MLADRRTNANQGLQLHVLHACGSGDETEALPSCKMVHPWNYNHRSIGVSNNKVIPSW
jgi:hypothetical protein